MNPDNGRLRILVATDVGLLEYTYAPVGAEPEGALDPSRAQVTAGLGVRGLRLRPMRRWTT